MSMVSFYTAVTQSVPHYFRAALDYVHATAAKVSSLSIYILPAKYSVRPDSFLDICALLFPKFLHRLWLECQRIHTVVGGIKPKELQDYEQTLKVFGKLCLFCDHNLTPEEIEHLKTVCNKAASGPFGLKTYDAHLFFKGDAELSELHRRLKVFTMFVDQPTYAFFREKIARIAAGKDLSENEKLTAEDAAILNAADYWTIAARFETLKVPGGEYLRCRWAELEKLTREPAMIQLLNESAAEKLPGAIYLGDRRVIDMLSVAHSERTSVLQQVFTGRICHIGIYVRPPGYRLHVSHVNPLTKCHQHLAVRMNFILPFSPSLNLDIRTLIPNSVPESHHDQLQGVFLKAFISRAEAQGSESAANGASYVAQTFIYAMQAVNLELDGMNKELIPEPFGEKVDLMHMDTLNLLYLWKKLGIVRTAPANAMIAKVTAVASVQSYLQNMFPSGEIKKVKVL